MSNEKLIEGLRELRGFLDGSGGIEGASFGESHPTKRGNWWWRSYLARIDQAIAALSTESIDVERLRELIYWLDRKWARHKEEEDQEAANMLRQLLRIAEGEK